MINLLICCCRNRLFTTSALITALMLSGCMRTDPQSVNNFVREEIQQQFPDATIESAGDDAIAVMHRDGNRQVIDLLPIQDACKRLPRSCSRGVTQLLVVMQDGLSKKTAGFKLDDVMPIISPPSPRAAIVQQNQPLAARVDQIAEGLAVRYAVLSDDIITVIDEQSIEKLNISPDVLLKTAFQNAEAGAIVNITPFPGEVLVHQVFGRIASSGILTGKHSEYAKKTLKWKNLAVAFPRPGMVLIADSDNSAGVARLRDIASRFYTPPLAVISNEVYLITPRGLAIMKK